MTIRLPAVLYWLAAGLWAGLIFFLSSQSRLPQPAGLSVAVTSTVGHLAAYFVLSLLLWLALRRSGAAAARATWIAVLMAVLYGASDEWHQSFVLGRDASLGDLALDLVGAGAAAFAARLRTSKPPPDPTEP